MYVWRGSYVTDSDPQLICSYTPSSQGLNPGDTSPPCHRQNRIINSEPDTWLPGSAELSDPVLTCRSSPEKDKESWDYYSTRGRAFVVFPLITPHNHVYSVMQQECTNPIKDLPLALVFKSSNQLQPLLKVK